MGAMSYEIQPHGTALVICLRGPFGLREVPTARGLLLKCLAECPSSVVVDLTDLTVTMPIALTVFPAVQRQAAAWPAVPLLLAGAAGVTAEALARSAITSVMRAYPDVERALAADEPAPYGRVQLRLRPTEQASAQARAFAADTCTSWALEELAPAATLIVTELVDNAARHARTDFVVTFAYRGTYLHISVTDRCPDPARLPHGRQEEPSEGGPRRGMRLVDIFATSWGTLPSFDGKTTWATLRV